MSIIAAIHKYFPDWEILHTRVQNLTWSHLKIILGEKSEPARLWHIFRATTNLDRKLNTKSAYISLKKERFSYHASESSWMEYQTLLATL